MITRSRSLPLVLAVALALAGCGAGGKDAAPRAAASTPTPTTSPDASPEPKLAAGKCDEVKYKPTDPPESTHPEANFYAPGAPNIPSKGDLDHLLLNDNAVVVTYAASTPEKTRDRLYDWTYKDVVNRTPIVVPDDSPDALGLRARIATVELRCNRINWKRLTAFANRTDIAPLARDD